MHEIGVLYKMLDQVEHIARENHVKKIKMIEVEIGELSGMLPIFFEQYYEPAVEHRELLKDSILKIREIPGEGLCLECHTLYNIMKCEGHCPKCKSRNKKVLGGTDFTIKNIVVEDE